MRSTVSLLFAIAVTAALAGSARAQPGQTPPAPPPDLEPVPYPPPPPPPYWQPAPVPLTPAEVELLEGGEISLGATVGGVALNWFVGFGLGQALQGRWSDNGWKFAVGEAAGFGMILVGIARICWGCTPEDRSDHDPTDEIVLLVGGLLTYVVTHTWSIVDAAVGPSQHNQRVRGIKRRLGIPTAATRVIPYASPARDGGGTVGFALRF